LQKIYYNYLLTLVVTQYTLLDLSPNNKLPHFLILIGIIIYPTPSTSCSYVVKLRGAVRAADPPVKQDDVDTNIAHVS